MTSCFSLLLLAGLLLGLATLAAANGAADASAVQAAAAIRALLGNCTKWAERADGSCPLSCKLWDVPGGHPEQMRLDKCARCSEGGNHPIRCLRCRWGYAHLRYDFMRQECLSIGALGCAQARPRVQYPTWSTVEGPCETCRDGSKYVWATGRSEDFVKGGPYLPPTVVDMSAAAAAAGAPASIPGNFPFPIMPNTGYSNITEARTWIAHLTCASCAQLGCPRNCVRRSGCKSCPDGSVLLKTGPPGNADTFKGMYRWAWLYNYRKRATPVLPSLCLRVKEDLGCAAGKAAAGKGCTACPKGRRLQRVLPIPWAGSRWLQLQPVGMGCY